MRLMMKSALERMLNTELDVHLGRRPRQFVEAEPAACAGEPAATPPANARAPNRRNGHSPKTVQGDLGELTIATPRDRDGTFEPQLIGKHQRRVPGFDEKIPRAVRQGHDHPRHSRDRPRAVRRGRFATLDLGNHDRSGRGGDGLADAAAGRVWPIVYFDGIVVHARGENGRVAPRTVYVALGVNLQGHKELLGLWLGENEGAKFWLGCLTDLKNRGLGDIFVACIDGLSGFAEAIHAAYPETKVQLCIVHLVRAALRYVSTRTASR